MGTITEHWDWFLLQACDDLDALRAHIEATISESQDWLSAS